MTSSKIDNMLNHQYVINDALHQLFDAVNAISVQEYDEERRVICWNVGSELLYGFVLAKKRLPEKNSKISLSLNLCVSLLLQHKVTG